MGRPTKAALEGTALMTKREQADAIKEYRQRLLLNPKSDKLIEELFRVAFTDDHRQQGVALKILADRVLPAAGFTADGKANNAVSINITGLGSSEPPGVIIEGTSSVIDDE